MASTPKKDPSLEQLLQVDWQEAAKTAVVYGRDGKPLPVEEITATEVDPGPAPSESRRPSFSINIERQQAKVGKPTIDRARPDLDSVGRLQEEANRVQAEALQEKQRQAAEAFLLTPQGQRIVALEQALAGALERLAALEAKSKPPTRTTNAKSKTDGN